jgi:hypothetical protein
VVRRVADSCPARVIAAALIAAACLSAPRALFAAPVKIPLHINYALLTEVLRQRLYARGGRAQLWNGNNQCEYLDAENPSFGQHDGIVQIDTGGYLNLGVPVGDHCLNAVTWSGIIEADTAPYIAGFALKLRVTDVNLYDRNHQKTLLVGRGFDLIKSNVVPAFEAYSFDLTPAIHELEGLAQMASGPSDQAALHLALATLRLEPPVTATQTGVQLRLMIDLPPGSPVPPIPALSAPLKPEEIAAWNTTLNNWDAFLVFAVKQLGATVDDPRARDELLNILLDSRERLVAALGQPQRLSGPDPVRLLFLEEWMRLGQVIENAAKDGRLGNRSLEFLSFISAGDALFALDQAAPVLGLRISADDLRRLARIMAPQASGDPLAYGFEEDPELRRMFGLSAPLELPGEVEVPQPATAASPNNSGEAPSGNDGHIRGAGSSDGAANDIAPLDLSPRSAPTRASGPVSLLLSSLCAVAPASALAAETVPHTEVSAGAILALGRRLHAVVVNQRNAASYRHDLNQLLDLAARYRLQDDALDASARRAWPTLLKAAAWQESCWRQYVIKQRRVWYLESKTGDIGLMQVNKYVWRGFYSLPRLRWDIVYNLSSGSEILQRFLTGSFNHLHSSNPAVLARSAYAAYNGGPGAYNRWRQPHESRVLREIDQAFWLKYRAVEAGQPFDILSCASQWDHLHTN